MRITSAGNLFIGTTAAYSVDGVTSNYTLQVSATESAPNYVGIAHEAAGFNARYHGLRCKGTLASKTAVVAEDVLVTFNGLGWDGGTTPTYVMAAGMTIIVDGTVAEDSVPARLSFWTRAVGDTSGTTERMRITNAGNVFVGTTAGVSVSGTTQTHNLIVYGTDSSPQFNGIISEGGACPGRFNGHRHNGTYGTKTAVATTQNLLGINAFGWDGGTTPTYVQAAAITFTVDGAVAEDSVPGSIIFYTREVGNTVSPYQRMVITNIGRVGIANNAPTALLTIGTNSTIGGAIDLLGATSGTCAIRVAAAAGTTTFQLPSTNGTSGYFLQTNGSGVTTWAAVTASAAGSTGYVQYNNGGALAAESGFAWDTTLKQVLIANNDINTGVRITTASTTDKFPVVNFIRYRNSIASPTAVQNEDTLGVLQFNGRGTTNIFTGAQIVSYAAGNFSDTSSPAYVIIRTVSSGSTTTVERLRITSDGKISTGAETAPDVDPGGICINHGANDGYPLTFKNSDVNHPFTAICEADTYLRTNKTDSTAGGANIIGLGTVAIGIGLLLGGACSTPASGTTEGCVAIVAYKSNGTTGFAALAATENLAAFRSYTTTQVIIKGSGDIHTVAGLKIGAYGQTAAAGAIQWSGTHFQGYNGSAWVDLDATGSGANTALSNLASVAINTALLPGTSNSIALGSTTYMWSDLFLGSGSVINWNVGNVTLTHSAGWLTLNGNLNLGTGKSLGSTGARIDTAFFDDLTVTNAIAGSITGNAATVTAANEASDTACYIAFVADATGSQGLKTNAGLVFNASTGDVGIGPTAPAERLHLKDSSNNGALIVGAHENGTPVAGTVEWDGTNFRGYTGSVWKNLDAGGGATVDAGTAAGQMLFWTGSAWTYAETSELAWDDTNKRVGIGCTTPTTLLTLGTAGTTAGKITLAGATSGTCVIQVAAAAGTGTIFQLPATNGTNGYFLKTDGSGLTSWAVATTTALDAGTAAGQVVFWDHGNTKWTYAETSEWVWDDTNKRVGINVAAPSSRLDVGGDVEIASDAWHYYGDPTTDGSWRTGRVSADLVVQKRESGTWTTKHTFA